MSDSQAYEEIKLSSDGVNVVKRFEEDEFPVPAIAFEFTSDRDESVTVTLSDTVPDDIEVEDLGFHPEYGSEYWTIDEDTIVFEKELDANSSYTTVYGIRATGSDDVEQFLTEPKIDDIDPPLPESSENIIPESDDDVVKDAIAGDGEIPGLEDEDDEDDEDVATLDLKDPNASDEQSQDSGGAEDGGEVETANVVGALANQIRQKNVSADDIKLLRRAFNPGGGDGGAVSDSGSDAARLNQLQQDISDLRAYTSALEEFLDENGTGDELIEDFEQQLNEFDRKLDSIESDIEENGSQVQSLSDEVDSATDELDEVTTKVSSVKNEVTGVTNEVESVSDEVDSVSEQVESVSEELESVTDDIDSMDGEVDSVSDEMDSLSGTVEDLESSIEELEEKVTEGDVAGRIDEIEEEIDSLQTWQEQIKETFGGG